MKILDPSILLNFLNDSNILDIKLCKTDDEKKMSKGVKSNNFT